MPETPYLILRVNKVREQLRCLREVLGPRVEVFYAVKANPHPGLLRLLAELGVGFEVASLSELRAVLRLGVHPRRIISSNPVKLPSFIEEAARCGVRRFAFDSLTELEKLARLAPGCEVYARLNVDDRASRWPLGGKFGLEPDSALELLAEAQSRGLVPLGVTFHVGSQCLEPQSWVRAIEKAHWLWKEAIRREIPLRLLNLGGGFPAHYEEEPPSLEEVGEAVREALENRFAGAQIIVEPGRALVGDAGTLVTSVIGKAEREGQRWLYLDVGVFNGLMESLGGIRYRVEADRDGPLRPWTLAGPTCDSFDVIAREVMLPDLEVGDRVYVCSAGAYTTAYASRFNGMGPPRVYLR